MSLPLSLSKAAAWPASTMTSLPTTSGEVERHELDLVVLSVGVEPPRDLAKISSLLTLSKTSDGFLMESHPKLKPVDAPTRGVFFAGFPPAASSPSGSLPPAGKSLQLTTLTSCLEVFSQEAALAIFTDRGASHLAERGLQTATVKVHEKTSGQASVSLTQNIINIGSSDTPFLMKAGENFTFRTGICLAPNRLPHRRRHDLRMYIWIGDQNNPYPTNREIQDAAHLGFNLFQMQDEPAGQLLQACLKMSLLYLICDEIIQDLEILTGNGSLPETSRNEPHDAELVLPALSPGGVILLNAPAPGTRGFDRAITLFRDQWQGPLFEISRPFRLFNISRLYFSRNARPLADASPPAVVRSASAALVVGMLVCGFTAVSLPALPLFGSRPVMRFFNEELEPVFGTRYLPSQDGDIFSVVQGYQGKRP